MILNYLDGTVQTTNTYTILNNLDTDIVPKETNIYNLGSVDKRFGELFISNNSIWLGETHKISISNDKLKFKKLKKDIVPQGLVIRLSNKTTQDIENEIKQDNNVTSLTEITLSDWVNYAKNQDSTITNINDIFTEEDTIEENIDIWLSNSSNIYFNNTNYDKIGIGTTNPTHNLHVEGDTLINGNLLINDLNIMTHIENTSNNLVTLVSNNSTSIGTTIENVTPTISPSVIYTNERMYPPTRNFTSSSHTISGEAYGNGLYETWESTSHNDSWKGFSAFQESVNVGYHALGFQYNTSGDYLDTNYIVSDYLGDWIKIKMPMKIHLTKYGFKARDSTYISRAPNKYKIYGSNNGTDWTELVHKNDTDISLSYSNLIYEENIIMITESYDYFALVVNKLIGGSNCDSLNLDEWYIYGKEVLVNIEPQDIPTTTDYKTLTFTYQNDYITDFQLKAEAITGVLGWKLVKYKPISDVWFSGNDNIQGNYELNHTTKLSTEEWAITWDDSTQNEVLFVKGNFVSWLRCNASSIDALNWTNPTALGGNKLTDGKFTMYRNEGNFTTSPYIFDHTVNYSDAYGDMIYQERQEVGYGGIPGASWPDYTDDSYYGPENYEYYVLVRNSSATSSVPANINTEYELTFDNPAECDILIVAGGGGGGSGTSGSSIPGSGGGAGGLIFLENQTVDGGTYTIKVGKGGDKARDNTETGQNGLNSSFSYLQTEAIGGGGGGSRYNIAQGQDGGSGGGGNRYADGSSALPGQGEVSHIYKSDGTTIIEQNYRQGFEGGYEITGGGAGDLPYTGGGGGAGGRGQNNLETPDTTDGDGGIGKSGEGSIDFKTLFGISDTTIGEHHTDGKVYFAGGGACGETSGNESTGGLGGGGDGHSDQLEKDGKPNTGGGGAGGKEGEPSNGGGNGGSGIVIIRYKTTNTKNSVNISSLIVNQTIEQPIVDIKKNDDSVLFIDELGNVGINNNTPEKKLHIEGDTLINGNLLINDLNIMTHIENTSNNLVTLISNNSTSIGTTIENVTPTVAPNHYYIDQSPVTEYTVLQTDATNLIAWYKFDGDFTDSSGNNNHLTSTNVTIVDGLIEQSADYDGSTSYSTTSGIDFAVITTYSVSFWVKFDTTPTGSQFFFQQGDENSIGKWVAFLYKGDNNILKFSHYGGSSGNDIDTSGYDIASLLGTNWNFLVVTYQYSDNSGNIYLNGVKLTTNRLSFNNYYTGSGDLHIARNQGINGDLNGLMEDFRIYDKKLTADEISLLYNKKVLVNIEPQDIPTTTDYKTLTFTYDATRYPEIDADATNLKAWYKFDGNLTDATDPTNSSKNLTSSTAVTYSSDSVKGNSCYLYSNNYLITPFKLKYLTDMGSFTISFWFKTDLTKSPKDTWNVIWSCSNFASSGAENRGLRLYLHSDNSLRFYTYQDGGGTTNYIYNNSITNSNTWVFLTTEFTYVSTSGNNLSYTFKLYLNNELITNTGSNNNQSITFKTNDTEYFTIMDDDNNSYPNEAYIDDFRIYDKALTADEINTLYNVNQTSYELTFDNPAECDILIVGGGGGGGTSYSTTSSIPGAGGGAGGLIFLQNQTIPANTYTIKVGKGGDGDIYSDTSYQRGKNGYNSSFTYLQTEAVGGGGGASRNGIVTGGSGGSGGGSVWTDANTSHNGIGIGTETNILKYDGSIIIDNYTQGFNGGVVTGDDQNTQYIPYSSGGGGSSEVGKNNYHSDNDALDGDGGNGKSGESSVDFKTLFGITDTTIGEHHSDGKVYFAGGGGAGYRINDTNHSTGGLGGGADSYDGNGLTGQNNTGGGGSGGRGSNGQGQRNGGNGGSGIVIIRYKTTNTKNSVNISSLIVNQTIEQPIIDIKKNDDSVLFIDELGNVGINNNTPEKKLHIEGDTLINGNLFVNDINIISHIENTSNNLTNIISNTNFLSSTISNDDIEYTNFKHIHQSPVTEYTVLNCDIYNLKIWYKFDGELIGSRIKDYGLLQNHLDIYGSSNGFNTTDYVVYPSSYENNAIDNNYLKMHQNLDLYQYQSTTGLSISFWFKITQTASSTNQYGSFFWFQNTTNSNNLHVRIYNNTNDDFLISIDTYAPSNFIRLTPDPPVNIWTHFVLTIDSDGNWSVYINNVNKLITKQVNLSNSIFDDCKILSGTNDDATIGAIMDDFRIYNKVLTVDEISLLYNRKLRIPINLPLINPKPYIEELTGMSDWIKIKHSPVTVGKISGNTFSGSIIDGTFTIGDENDNTAEWAIPFNSDYVKYFCFHSKDSDINSDFKDRWIVIERSEMIKEITYQSSGGYGYNSLYPHYYKTTYKPNGFVAKTSTYYVGGRRDQIIYNRSGSSLTDPEIATYYVKKDGTPIDPHINNANLKILVHPYAHYLMYLENGSTELYGIEQSVYVKYTDDIQIPINIEPELIYTDIKRYPETASTGNYNGDYKLAQWSDGLYIVKAKGSDSLDSSNYGVWELFNHVITGYDDTFHTNILYSTDSIGNFTGNTTFKGIPGTYIIIDLGREIYPYVLNIAPRDNTDYTTIDFTKNAPGLFKVYGSNNSASYEDNDHDSWTLILDQITKKTYTNQTYTTYNLDNRNKYRYFAINFTHIYGNTDANYGYLLIGELYFEGTETFDFDYKTLTFGYDESLISYPTLDCDSYNLVAHFTFDDSGNLFNNLGKNEIQATGLSGNTTNDGDYTQDGKILGGLYKSSIGDITGYKLSPSNLLSQYFLNKISFTFWIKNEEHVAPHLFRQDGVLSIGIWENAFRVVIYDTSSTYLYYEVDDQDLSFLQLNEWVHVVVTIDVSVDSSYENCIKVYRNGINRILKSPPLSTSYTLGNNFINSTNDFKILGRGDDGGGNGFKGYIDDLRFYDKVLSQEEVKSLYTQYNQTKYEINFSNPTKCDILIVGGGGAGGVDNGGGGGGGGVLYATDIELNGNYIIKVGDGGKTAIPINNPDAYNPTNSGNGYSSEFGKTGDMVEVLGGGYGGNAGNSGDSATNGGYGASGGGGVYNDGKGGIKLQPIYNTFITSANSIYYSGNGGDGILLNSYIGGGGGGASGIIPTNHNGADGIQIDIDGNNYYWGGGGGGIYWENTAGSGGLGGGGGAGGLTGMGGLGGLGGITNGEDGTGAGSGSTPQGIGGNGGAGTGGGGGGDAYSSPNKGGNGGSGIVIIRYKETYENKNNLISIKNNNNKGIAINNKNYIGINNDYPTNTFDINGNININNNENKTALIVTQNTNLPIVDIKKNNDSILFIDNLGNIGINNKLPQKNLHIEVDTLINDNDLIIMNGNIGIGTDNFSQHKLHVIGNTNIDGDLNVSGGLTISGGQTTIDTNQYTTEQLSITNDGSGPALLINQNGTGNILDIKEHNNNILFIKDGGNIGIGTTNPEYDLDIRSSSPIINLYGNNNNDIVGLRISSNNNYNTAPLLYLFANGEDNSCQIVSRYNYPIKFFTNNTFAMSIDTNQNIGIGTISPTVPLQVGIGTTVSNVDYKSSVCILSEQKPNEELIALSLVNYNTTNPPTSFGTACSIAFHINKDWEPTAKIMAINTDINISSTTTYKQYTDLVFYTFYHGPLSESMRITCQGDVGIGIDTPVSKLDVDGNLNIRGDINFTGLINQNSIPIALSTEITVPANNNNNKVSANIGIYGTDYAFIDLRTNNNLGGWIDFSSIAGEDFSTRIRGHNNPVKLEFYASSTPDMILNSNGDLNVKGNITAYYSDERLKTKIEDIDNVLDKIKNISVFKYKPNDIATKYGFSNKQEIGLSAQQISYFYPELVSLAPFDREYDNETKMDKSKSGENYLTLNYERLVPILIQGIKELTKENEFLKNEIIDIKKIINNKN